MEKPGLISDQQMNLLVEKENEFAAQDRRERERADARNALEEFIYDMRDKISSVYEEFIKPDDSETYRAKLQSAEDWLYEDDADDRPKKVRLVFFYKRRGGGLGKMGGQLVFRGGEFDLIVLYSLFVVCVSARCTWTS